MKKIIVLALALIVCIASTYAQGSYQLSPAAGDIMINAAQVIKNFQVTTGSNGVIIQASYTLNSGTGAGTAQLAGSLDNVNFTNIQSAYTITNTATQSNQWIVTQPLPPYLKITFGGGTTENLTIKVWVRAPKYQPTP